MSRTLAKVADTLTLAERRTYAVLSGAPKAIIRGQASTGKLRRLYRQLEFQLQKAQQALALTGLTRFAWQWYTRRRRPQYWVEGHSPQKGRSFIRQLKP